jgi:hypothetical protein
MQKCIEWRVDKLTAAMSAHQDPRHAGTSSERCCITEHLRRVEGVPLVSPIPLTQESTVAFSNRETHLAVESVFGRCEFLSPGAGPGPCA